ncbi:methyltransferase domain-containing protein [Balneolaceae bacterium YR4-1]|uniref:Methyltransferase domain-containing protein n=1 Tax=Halalkalibaculum roseum TaxID=2709311 RepID=A0A6M1SR89_9BACT|nr:class I SAM-dependent methyltransferase [Halalkalibaculum roseum]NGP77599.1 methyltransferase domain-containing protein [Halalkalibaculum roseum]
MKEHISCILCGNNASPFGRVRERDFYECQTCRAVIMDPDYYVDRDDEVYRYETHDNDVNDPRYQNFVSPLVDAVKKEYESGKTGLDYGSGTGPVAAKLLRDAGYEVTTYDPYFERNPGAFLTNYDFIISSEVVEHFHHPAKEFRLLRELLKPGGHLYCMTLRYEDEIDFESWHYAQDETHVIFYRKETAEWIKEAFNFSGLEFEERLFILEK